MVTLPVPKLKFDAEVSLTESVVPLSAAEYPPNLLCKEEGVGFPFIVTAFHFSSVKTCPEMPGICAGVKFEEYRATPLVILRSSMYPRNSRAASPAGSLPITKLVAFVPPLLTVALHDATPFT